MSRKGQTIDSTITVKLFLACQWIIASTCLSADAEKLIKLPFDSNSLSL